MELYRKRKILLLALAACIVFSVVSAETLIASEHDHDCTGEGCPVCLQIEAAGCFLKTLKLTVIGLLLIAFSILFNKLQKKYACFNLYFISPIFLKVRFNT